MEDAYLISGGKKLSGKITLSGAKNVALKVIIGALMFRSRVVLDNIPRINDVFELIHLVKILGGRAEFTGKNSLIVDGNGIKTNKVDLLHASKIRVSFLLFAPLLIKFGDCYIPNPGGCRIGARPIDRIVDGMKSLGIKVLYDHKTGYYHAQMKIKPFGSYRFPKPTHTGTELLILMSVLSDKSVRLDNCALEPEIDDLINFLNDSGADIKRQKGGIIIRGKKQLEQKQPYAIICDRNEAVTYISSAIATKGWLEIGPIPFELIRTFYNQAEKIGVKCERLKDNRYKFVFTGKLQGSKIETAPHPGFMTDWQPNWAVLMTQAIGESTIVERVFENRFSYVSELRKIGADIDFIQPVIIDPKHYYFFNVDPAKEYYQGIRIAGPQRLHGGVINISDLRAGATLAIGALAAEGESIINGANILERGYENFVEKIRSLGGTIRKV